MKFYPTNNLPKERFSIMPLFDDFLKRFNYFSDEREGNLMAMDIIERDREYLVKANLPGIRKENIKISYRDKHLTIEARREKVVEEKGTIHYSERFSGDYLRTVFIPENCDHENIKANLSEGILTLVIPKIEKKSKEIVIE